MTMNIYCVPRLLSFVLRAAYMTIVTRHAVPTPRITPANPRPFSNCWRARHAMASAERHTIATKGNKLVAGRWQLQCGRVLLPWNSVSQSNALSAIAPLFLERTTKGTRKEYSKLVVQTNCFTASARVLAIPALRAGRKDPRAGGEHSGIKMVQRSERKFRSKEWCLASLARDGAAPRSRVAERSKGTCCALEPLILSKERVGKIMIAARGNVLRHSKAKTNS